MTAAPDTRRQTVIGLLGPVSIGGVEVPGVRAKRLLCSLALAGGRARSADRLIDDVWGDEPPRSPTSALHTQISRLRQLLGDGAIVPVGSGYRLDRTTTDLDLAQAILSEGDAGSLAKATALWRGSPGDDLGSDGDLGVELRRRSDALSARLDEIRGVAALSSGDYATAREIAEKRCAADVLDETGHVLLMRALAGLGRRSDALAVFAKLRRALASNLGVDPGSEAVALNAELLQDDSTLRVQTSRRGRAVGLRADPSPLIGRDDDLVAINDLVATQRIVTILGPGGAGKTRMGNAVGNALAAQGKNVFFVPLASVRNNDDVVAVLASALGVGETDLSSSGRPRLAVGELSDRLSDALRGQETVLILDNCEQVVDACARMVADLVAAEPNLSVLTTSRSPLQIAGEQVYPLPMLNADGATSPAVTLFTMRAHAVRPNADLDPEKVAALCEHLDGLPLAIELAAARVRALSVDEITERIVARFELLRSVDRTAPDRHRTLHAVIEWSWDLLDDEARRALRRMCRFPAGFSSAAAQAVLNRSGASLDDVLDSLVNQSLLNVGEAAGKTRYRMLEMVREFGEEKLAESGEGDEVDDAMATWARAYTREARRQYDISADRGLLMSLADEVENLVWVLRRAIENGCGTGVSDSATTIVSVFPAVGILWAMRGLHAEVRSWGVRLLDVLPPPPTDLDDELRELWQSTLLGCAAHLIMMPSYRQLGRARWYLRRLHRPELSLELPMEFLSSILLSGSTYAGMRAIVLGTESSNPDVRRAALALRMNVRENKGDLARALADSDELRKLAGVNDPWFDAMITVNTASIVGQQGDWTRAAEYYRSGLRNLMLIGADEDELQARAYLVVTLLSLNRIDEAEAELAVMADGWTPDDPDPKGNPEVIAAMIVCFAELARLRGEPAGQLYRRAGLLLQREHPLVARDPGVAMLVGIIVIGMCLSGEVEQSEEFVRTLAMGVEASFAATGWHDLPQAGVTAVALGLFRGGRDGAYLLQLADRLRVRRDYPSTNEALRRGAEIVGCDDAHWAELHQRVGRLSRRQAVEELQAYVLPIVDETRPTP